MKISVIKSERMELSADSYQSSATLGSGFHFPLFSLMLLFLCFYLEIVEHVDSKSRQIISKTLSLTVLVEVFIAVKRDYDHSNSYNGKHFAGL